MRRISIINQKGGVGKTTTTTNLGAACSKAGLRTLLIDLDPQAHLTLHFNVNVGDDQKSVYDVLTNGTPLTDVIVSIGDNVKIVPSDTDLAGAEAELIAVPGREVILREAIDMIADQFDVLLIDCPPALGVLTLNALTATNEVIIPLQAQFFALQGLGQLLNTVSLVRQRINPNICVSGMIFCMHESATRLAGEVESDLAKFLENARGTDAPWSNARIYNTRIRRNIKLAEASSFGQSVFDYAPKSKGAIDYQALTQEVFNLPEHVEEKPPVVSTMSSASTNGRARIAKTKKPKSKSKEAPAKPTTSPTPAPVPASTSTDRITTASAAVTVPDSSAKPIHNAPQKTVTSKPIRKKTVVHDEPAIATSPAESPAQSIPSTPTNA